MTEQYKLTRSRSISFDYGQIIQNTEIQEFEKKWKNLSSVIERNNELAKLDKEYKEIAQKHPSFAPITYNSLFGNTSPGVALWMPGISLLATYLKKKKNLKGLFVCASQTALINQINTLITSSDTGRWALIFPSWGERPLHKSTLLIEKNGDKIEIALLDAIGSSYDPENSILSKVADICENKGNTVRTFYPQVQREFTNYGCAIFALQDSISFLQDPLFFTKLNSHNGMTVGSRFTQVISDLPPEYMIGTQSAKRLEKYIQTHKDSTLALPKRKKTLEEYQKKYTIYDPNGNIQNHYITHKMFKYMWFCITTLKELPSRKIQELIDESLVV